MALVIDTTGSNTLTGTAGADILIGLAEDDTYTVNNIGDVCVEEDGEGTDLVNSSVSYTLSEFIEKLTLTGSGAIDGTGNALGNTLKGNSGANVLDGGLGKDTMEGGDGNDTYVVDNTADVVTENANEGTDTILSSVTITDLAANVENLILTGTSAINGTGNTLDNLLIGNSGANKLNGGVGADVLVGNAGSDKLDGGAGADALSGGSGSDTLNGGGADGAADTLVGGSGNDTYVVDSTLDQIVEQAKGGTDTIESSITYTLAALDQIENLTLTGTGAINGTGNALANTLTGNDGANTLNGGAGADKMVGGKGNDTYVVDDKGDKITEGTDAGTDTVRSEITYTLAANLEDLELTGTTDIDGTGNTLTNTLTGNTGDNTLDGGKGADTMIGDKGDDTYVVDDASDVVTEVADEGTDTVESSVTHTLASNVENLTLTGTTAIDGTGNTLANTITGNSKANTLIGLGGNDIYVVGTGDTVVEASDGGTDTVQSSVNYTLDANVENLTLTGTGNITGTGNALANTITGNSGANTLDGGAADNEVDTLVGGKGNDTYVVDTTTDIITEEAGGGTDTIKSSITYTLASLDQIENLTLTGTGAINGTGNDLVNTLTGNDGANTLNGGKGADKMLGGAGNDSYIVDNTGDKITEKAGEGADSVTSTVTYTLAANVENLTLSGTAAINGTGNGDANILIGNDLANTLNGAAGADAMTGGLGDDTYVVDNVGDSVTEVSGEGTDTIQSSVNFDLSTDGANVENLTLTGTAAIDGTGNTLKNTLTGNSGINVLDGGTGADTMIGGKGNDSYVVDNANDTIQESAGSGTGTDSVTSSVSYTLAANVENLTLGAGAINGTGNTSSNVLTGGAGKNTLTGDAGNDTLDGKGGNDKLVGGAGADNLTGGDGLDTFYYAALSETGKTDTTRDVITDFDHSEGDIIDISALNGEWTFSETREVGAARQVVLAYDADNVVGVLSFYDGTDETPDAMIQLTGLTAALTADDFSL